MQKILRALALLFTLTIPAAALDLSATTAGRWGTSYDGIDGLCWTNGFAGNYSAGLTNPAVTLKCGSAEAKTWAVWIKPNGYGAIMSCTADSSSGTYGWFLNRDGSGAVTLWYSVNGTSYSTWTTGFTMSLNEWHLIVLVVDNVNDIAKVSLDGVPFATRSFSGAVATSSFPFALGCRWNAGIASSSLHGLYDELTILDTSWTDSKVNEHWAGGTGSFYVP